MGTTWRKVFGMLLIFATILSADTLDIRTSTLSLVPGITTNSTSYSDVLATNFNMPAYGSALVLSTFSSEIGKGASEDGFWQLTDGTNSSMPLCRHQSGSSDKGIGSAVHIFSGLSSGNHSVRLQHRVDQNKKPLTTFGVNTVVVPLVTSGGSALTYDLEQTSVDVPVGSIFSPVMAASITLPLSSGNNAMYIAASFNSMAAAEETGQWKLQYSLAGTESWFDVGLPIERYMSSVDDKGVVTLYGLANGLEQGTYDVRLVAKAVGSNSVVTTNGTLAVVSLSYNDGGNDRFFPAFSVNSAGGAYSGSGSVTIPGASKALSITETTDIFVAMNFGGYASQGANQTGQFDIALMSGATASQTNQANQRFFSDGADKGSGGSVGLLSNVVAGSYTIDGRHDLVSGSISTTNVNLVGFSKLSKAVVVTPALGLEITREAGVLLWRVGEEVGVAKYVVSRLVDGEWVDVDVVVADGSDEYSIEVPESAEYRIIVVDTDGSNQVFGLTADGNESIGIELNEGWNLISIPYENADLSEFHGQFWGWNGVAYEVVPEPQPKQGVWFYSKRKKVVGVSGKKPTCCITAINAGWSLVGPVTNNAILEVVDIYTWGERYVQIAEESNGLIVGRGYWLFTTKKQIIEL